MNSKNNILICGIFQQMKDHWKGEHQYRVKAYTGAIDAICMLDYEITSSKDVKGISGIGKRSLDRIDEILTTGKLQELEELNLLKQLPFMKIENEPSEEELVIAKFKKIHGVGDKIGKKWYNLGYRKITDIPINMLTSAQKIGIKYYDDINQRIPRDEIVNMNSYLQSNIINANKHNKRKDGIQLMICGSFRRQHPDCGDIDIMVTHQYDNNVQIMDYLISILPKVEILSKGNKKFMGLCKIDQLFRRIDIELVKPEEYPYALLYFTGSKDHNIMMRDKAVSKGWRLNEKEMYVIKTGEKINIKDEKEIFSLLEIT